MTLRPESWPRPPWLVKIMAAKVAALEALTPEELAEAEAAKAARRGACGSSPACVD